MFYIEISKNLNTTTQKTTRNIKLQKKSIEKEMNNSKNQTMTIFLKKNNKSIIIPLLLFLRVPIFSLYSSGKAFRVSKYTGALPRDPR